MRDPNFFLVGAPRSGTTSLYMWLKQHPAIFMPRDKEPWYFADDIVQFVDNLTDYERLFAKAGPEHLRVGEASTIYLYSEHAVKAIENKYPGALYIVLLRNPVDLIRSFHQILQRNIGTMSAWENEPDFERAWLLQQDRMDGRTIPPGCPSAQLLQYREFGLLGKYCNRLTQVVNRERVLFLNFDKLSSSPNETLNEVLEFLGLRFESGIDFSAHNATHGRRSLRLLRITNKALNFRRRVPWVPHGTGILNAIDSWNKKPIPPNIIAADFRRKLVEEYMDDINLLRKVTGLELGQWPN